MSDFTNLPLVLQHYKCPFTCYLLINEDRILRLVSESAADKYDSDDVEGEYFYEHKIKVCVSNNSYHNVDMNLPEILNYLHELSGEFWFYLPVPCGRDMFLPILEFPNSGIPFHTITSFALNTTSECPEVVFYLTWESEKQVSCFVADEDQANFLLGMCKIDMQIEGDM